MKLYNMVEIALYIYAFSIICENFKDKYHFDHVIVTTKNNTKIVYSVKYINRINFLFRNNLITGKYSTRYIKDISITIENEYNHVNYSLNDLTEFIDISELL